MLLPKKPGTVPDVLNNSLPEIAVRIPDHPLTLALLQELDFPLAAPSANPFGYISPTTPDHVMKQLGGKIPYILDGGPCRRGIESTIVRFDGDEVVVLRQGAIPTETILQTVEKVRLHVQKSATVVAPGMLASHYAPRTKLILVDDAAKELTNLPTGNYGALLFDHSLNSLPAANQIVLSPTGDAEESAARLYAALHELDAQGFDLIVAERHPNTGVGAAINDRLTRAAH
jgi:L-threonylcarbamoyladenylate synthase